MAVALLYGAVDFLISKKNGDMSKLYDDKAKTSNNSAKEENKSTSNITHTSFIQNAKDSIMPPPPKSMTTKNKKAKKVKQREITSEEFSRAPLREDIEEVVVEDTIEQK